MVIVYERNEYIILIAYNNITIMDSYKIKSLKEMKEFLYEILKIQDVKERLKDRTIDDMVSEWRVHNLLYALGIYKEKTSNVDFESYPNKYLKMLYRIGSIFYPHW